MLSVILILFKFKRGNKFILFPGEKGSTHSCIKVLFPRWAKWGNFWKFLSFSYIFTNFSSFILSFSSLPTWMSYRASGYVTGLTWNPKILSLAPGSTWDPEVSCTIVYTWGSFIRQENSTALLQTVWLTLTPSSLLSCGYVS